jgi:hypothetical protein
MKWYKHMSDMSSDVKIKRIIRRYGIEGYGLYCYILELIVRKLETDSPLPELEESAQDIAGDMGMDTLRVEEIIRYAIDQGLFELDAITGKVVGHRIYKYLQQSETRSKQIRAMIGAYKSGVSQTVIDNCEEQNRIEQKRREETPPKSDINPTRYANLVTDYGQAVVDDYIQRCRDYVASGKHKAYSDYAAAAANWLKRDKVPTLAQRRPALHVPTVILKERE